MSEEILNPYAPPLAELENFPAEGATPLPPAGKGKRFLNLILDQLMLQSLIYGLYRTPLLEGFEISWAFSFFSGYILEICWHFFNELCGGRGINKLITGTRVVMKDGSPLTPTGALLRSLCRCIPFEAFSFLGAGPSGWHDTIPGTRVVDLRARPKRISKPGPMPTQPSVLPAG